MKSNKKLNILLCDQFYYPDESAIAQILTDLSLGLAERDFSLTVMTGSERYAGDWKVDPLFQRNLKESGIRIRRLPRLIPGDFKRLRFFRQLWFYFGAFWMLLFSPRPDLYVTQTTPPLLPVLFRVLTFFKRRPYVVIAQDLWPEALREHGLLSESHPLYRFLRLILNSSYRSALRVVSLGNSMEARLKQKGIPDANIRNIPNWALRELEELAPEHLENEALEDPGLPADLRKRLESKKGLSLLYSGNMGMAHEFRTLLEGVEAYRAKGGTVQMLFAGGGGRKPEIQAMSEELNSSIEFLPHQPREFLKYQLLLGEVSVVTMLPNFVGLVVPSKLYGILALARPLLYIGPPSEISDAINEGNCGIHIPNGEPELLAQKLDTLADPTIRKAMGARALELYREKLGYKRSMDLYGELLKDALS